MYSVINAVLNKPTSHKLINILTKKKKGMGKLFLWKNIYISEKHFKNTYIYLYASQKLLLFEVL